jgi:hypothetical protein
MTEQIMGATIKATTIPAIKVDEVYTVDGDNGSVGSAPSTERKGIQPKYVEIHRATPVTLDWRKNNPHKPYTMEGTAAMRSTKLTNVDCNLRGAYSEI